VVGLTIVTFGTSALEVAVSVGAVMDGRTDIALGAGSNPPSAPRDRPSSRTARS
jgi:hypothetical protein